MMGPHLHRRRAHDQRRGERVNQARDHWVRPAVHADVRQDDLVLHCGSYPVAVGFDETPWGMSIVLHQKSGV